MSIYNDSFYAKQCNGSSRSAKAILPVLFKEIGTPSSVLDIGCGVGTWAAAAMDCGVKTVIGIDGSYVPKDRLHIPKELFFDCDLNSKIKVFEKKLALPGFPWVADLLMSFPEGTNEGYGPIFSDSRADRALVC